MEMGEQERNASKKDFGGFDRLLARIAAIATVIGLAAAIYFGIKTREHKQIEINYLAKLSLISPDASPTEKIRVSYDGKVVTNLSKIAIRYSNSGAIPIESKDIEEPLTLNFSNSTVLDAKIVEMHPNNLQAEISSTNNLVIVKNGLLNPGDMLQIEVLCDGDPNWPKATFRISGINEPITVFAQKGNQTINIAYFTLPKSVQYFILVIATVAGAILIFGFFVALVSGLKPFFANSGLVSEKLNTIDTQQAFKHAVLNLNPEMRRPIFMAKAFETAQDWFDKPDILIAEFAKEPVKSYLNSKNINPAEFTQKIHDEICSSLPNALGQQFFFTLPAGFDSQGKKIVSNMKCGQGVSYNAFVSQAVAKVKEELFVSTFSKKIQRIDKDNLIIAMIFLALSLPLSLILAGSWKIILNP